MPWPYPNFKAIRLLFFELRLQIFRSACKEKTTMQKIRFIGTMQRD